MEALKGMVASYLRIQQFKPALLVAKEALQLRPRSLQALTLVGEALASNPEGQERAAQAFNKALTLSPGYPPALMALGRLYCEGQLFDKAVNVFKGPGVRATAATHSALGY